MGSTSSKTPVSHTFERVSSAKPDRPAAAASAPSDSALNIATAVPPPAVPPQPPQVPPSITEMSSVSDAGLVAADTVECLVPRIAQRVAGGSLRLDGSVRECIAALRCSSATFASSARRVAQHRSRWLDKQAEECDGVEKLFRACARVCDVPMVSEDMVIEDSVGAVLPLLACDSLPRLSGYVGIDGVEACQFAGVLSASIAVHRGVGRVDVSGTGVEVCLPGEDAASIKNNSVQVLILDDFGVAIPGLLLTDFTIAVTDECGSSVGTLISPTLCDDSAVRFSYIIPTTLVSGSVGHLRVCVVLFGEPVLSQDVQVAYGFFGKYCETIPLKHSDAATGIAFSPDGSLVVLSLQSQHCVEVRAFPSFECIRTIGEEGRGRGQFKSPGKVCFLPLTGNILVADTNNYRVQEVTVTGEHVRFLGIGVCKGGIASVAANTSLIAAGNHNLGPQVYLFDAVSGALVRSFSQYGDEPGDLSMCLGLRFSPDGEHLYIAEYATHRVSKFTLDGVFVTCIGAAAEIPALDVEVALNGDVAVSSAECLSIFSASNADGRPLRITSFGPSDCHSFVYPTAMAAFRGRLYVVDKKEAVADPDSADESYSPMIQVFM